MYDSANEWEDERINIICNSWWYSTRYYFYLLQMILSLHLALFSRTMLEKTSGRLPVTRTRRDTRIPNTQIPFSNEQIYRMKGYHFYSRNCFESIRNCRILKISKYSTFWELSSEYSTFRKIWHNFVTLGIGFGIRRVQPSVSIIVINQNFLIISEMTSSEYETNMRQKYVTVKERNRNRQR